MIQYILRITVITQLSIYKIEQYLTAAYLLLSSSCSSSSYGKASQIVSHCTVVLPTLACAKDNIHNFICCSFYLCSFILYFNHRVWAVISNTFQSKLVLFVFVKYGQETIQKFVQCEEIVFATIWRQTEKNCDGIVLLWEDVLLQLGAISNTTIIQIANQPK